MLFSSISFLYYFLPVVLAVYFAVPFRLKNPVLLAASLFFYFWGEPVFVLVMLASCLSGYVHGLLIGHFKGRPAAKAFMISSVVVGLGMLGFFKYTNFFIDNANTLLGAALPSLKIVLPIGISFFTFQILSYTVDVYRGDAEVQRSFIKLSTYVALFPQLIAGPIVRYTDVERELSSRRHGFDLFASGAVRFLVGLGKKVLIANVLGELVSAFRGSNDKSVLFYWVYAAAYSLHIYFDFSGYSDMAIGLGRIFGFKFLENFNYPFIARSATEFWRRWHMSLGSWFRDYVYIPLGGNRVSRPRWFFNIAAVWFLTGFWHGADWTFIVWGLYFAVFLILEKQLLLRLLEKLPRAFSHVYLLAVVLFSFVIFDGDGIGGAAANIRGMLGLSGAPLFSAETGYYLRNYAFVLLAAAFGATPLLKNFVLKIREKNAGRRALNALEPAAAALLLAACTAYLVDGSFNPFLYFRF